MTELNDNQPFNERRFYNRVGKSFSMYYRVWAPDALPIGELDRQGDVCDISAGGLRFITEGELNKNEQLIILLEFSGWKVDGEEWISTGNPDDNGKLKVLGRVMWCNKLTANSEQEVGICFVGSIS